MDRSDVLSVYREGVRAVRWAAEGWPPERWCRRVAGCWTATDVAGHLLWVVGCHHTWLDRAEAGVASPPFTPAEFVDRNRHALAGLRPTFGQDRLGLFVEEAERYAERLDSSWALSYGFPCGTVPAGTHAALAAFEYHLRAWDLSDGHHRPTDPGTLLVGARRALLTVTPGLRARVGAAVAPLVGRNQPWEWALAWTGRVDGPVRAHHPQGPARPEIP